MQRKQHWSGIENKCSNCYKENFKRACKFGCGVITWKHCEDFQPSIKALEEKEKERERRRKERAWTW